MLKISCLIQSTRTTMNAFLQSVYGNYDWAPLHGKTQRVGAEHR